jgi:murein DD-endopeptidase MepM/ murein hydrolase activator NlpD
LTWGLSLVFILAILPRPMDGPAEIDSSFADAALPPLPQIEIVEGSVKKNATLVATFVDLGVPIEIAHDVTRAIQNVFDVRTLRSGNGFRLEKEANGTLHAFEYKINDEKVLEVQKADEADAYEARVSTLEFDSVETVVTAEITSSRNSLYAALEEKSVLAGQIAQIFAWDVDFNSDLQVNDRIQVVLPALYHEGQFVKWGKIQAAELFNSSKTYQAFLFMESYYDAKGNALKRSFLASPLPFNPRITSGFSRRRLHPILGTARPHLAVDYGAPTGTPVQAVANGTVVSAGPNGSYGNLVQIRHSGGLTTGYAHLSRIESGIRAGTKVDQGQLIGRVGQTGLATGPHLHFMMSRNGQAINPLSMKAEPPVPLDGKLRPAFEAHIAPMQLQFGQAIAAR